MLWIVCHFGISLRRFSTWRCAFRVNPFGGAVSPVLLFPNWDFSFQRVNQPTPGFKTVGPMGRTHRDRNAGFAELDRANAMDD